MLPPVDAVRCLRQRGLLGTDEYERTHSVGDRGPASETVDCTAKEPEYDEYERTHSIGRPIEVFFFRF